MWLYRRIDKRTADRCINAINRYLPNGVREPKDLDDIVTKTKYFPLGLRNFLNFLEDQYYIDSLNGFSFALWRKHLPTKSANSRGGKVFITDEHIREALKLIEEKWNDEATTTLYKLLVYSGIRLKHAWKQKGILRFHASRLRRNVEEIRRSQATELQRQVSTTAVETSG